MKHKILIVLPAYNAEKTLKQVISQIPKSLSANLLLVDDGSKDKTVKLSKKLKIKTIVHQTNQGYGANQKTCYTYALKTKADYVIMLHPDGQYNPQDLPKFIKQLKQGADLVLGSRFIGQGYKKTPFYKSISIRIITFLFNLVLGTNLSEANTGYRGFSRKLLETVPWQKNGNSYIFDPQMIIQAKYFNLKIVDVAIFKDYHEAASSPNLFKSIEHGLENIYLLVEYLLHQLKIRKTNFLTI